MDEQDRSVSNPSWHDHSGYSRVELYADGAYKSLVPEIDTEWMLGGRPIALRAGHAVSFFPNGAVERGVLAARTALTAFGVAVAAAEGTRVDFYASGEVRSLTLASQPAWFRRNKPWTYRGGSYEPGSTLVFSEDGSVENVTQPE